MISESPTESPSWFLRHHPKLLLDFQRLPLGEAVGGLISEKDFFLFACPFWIVLPVKGVLGYCPGAVEPD
jgi:hypothetical protein